MSPAGTSVYSPRCRYSSVMNDWQNRITSASLRPLGSKSLPPLPPPMGSPVREFLKICSKPRNFTMPRYTLGWNRSPPLYGPSAELNSTRKPRFTWTLRSTYIQGTRKMIWRSGSQSRRITSPGAYSGCLATTGPRASKTSRTAWWNSVSPGLRAMTSSKMSTSCSSKCATKVSKRVDDAARPALGDCGPVRIGARTAAARRGGAGHGGGPSWSIPTFCPAVTICPRSGTPSVTMVTADTRLRARRHRGGSGRCVLLCLRLGQGPCCGVTATEAEGERRSQGTSDHHRAEGQRDDRVGDPHVLQAHRHEQGDRGVPDHCGGGTGADRGGHDLGHQEADSDDHPAEQHASAQGEHLVQDGGDLREVQRTGRHDREEHHDRDLHDPGEDPRGALVLGHDAQARHPRSVPSPRNVLSRIEPMNFAIR